VNWPTNLFTVANSDLAVQPGSVVACSGEKRDAR